MRPNPQESADLVTFTGEMVTAKLHFLSSESLKIHCIGCGPSYILINLQTLFFPLCHSNFHEMYILKKNMWCVAQFATKSTI